MSESCVRVLCVPGLPAETLVAVRDASASVGPLRSFRDPELDCVAIELEPDATALSHALENAARALVAAAPERFFRIEVSGADQSQESTLGEMLACILDANVWTARREVPASQWVATRPLEFSVDGLHRPPTAPTHARIQSRCYGVALEFGAPLLTVRAGLQGVDASALARMRDAVGSDRGGLLHVGAAPTTSVRSGAPLLMLSCSDPVKSPLHRALALIDIEARRYGGALGTTALLSSLPLAACLGALAGAMGLDAKPAQIIETHLAKRR